MWTGSSQKGSRIIKSVRGWVHHKVLPKIIKWMGSSRGVVKNYQDLKVDEYIKFSSRWTKTCFRDWKQKATDKRANTSNG